MPATTMLQNPVVSFSSSIWMALGYIYPKDWRCLLTMVPSGVIVTLQFCYLIFSDKGLENKTLHAYLSFLHFNCLVRESRRGELLFLLF